MHKTSSYLSYAEDNKRLQKTTRYFIGNGWSSVATWTWAPNATLTPNEVQLAYSFKIRKKKNRQYSKLFSYLST